MQILTKKSFYIKIVLILLCVVAYAFHNAVMWGIFIALILLSGLGMKAKDSFTKKHIVNSDFSWKVYLKVYLALLAGNVGLTLIILLGGQSIGGSQDLIDSFCSGVSDCWAGFGTYLLSMLYFVLSALLLIGISILYVKRIQGNPTGNKKGVDSSKVFLWIVGALYIFLIYIAFSDSIHYQTKAIRGYERCYEEHADDERYFQQQAPTPPRLESGRVDWSQYSFDSYCHNKLRQKETFENNLVYIVRKKI